MKTYFFLSLYFLVTIFYINAAAEQDQQKVQHTKWSIPTKQIYRLHPESKRNQSVAIDFNPVTRCMGARWYATTSTEKKTTYEYTIPVLPDDLSEVSQLLSLNELAARKYVQENTQRIPYLASLTGQVGIHCMIPAIISYYVWNPKETVFLRESNYTAVGDYITQYGYEGCDIILPKAGPCEINNYYVAALLCSVDNFRRKLIYSCKSGCDYSCRKVKKSLQPFLYDWYTVKDLIELTRLTFKSQDPNDSVLSYVGIHGYNASAHRSIDNYYLMDIEEGKTKHEIYVNIAFSEPQ